MREDFYLLLLFVAIFIFLLSSYLLYIPYFIYIVIEDEYYSIYNFCTFFIPGLSFPSPSVSSHFYLFAYVFLILHHD
jgi:hypothetical protein